jgi:DNA-binding HxlR family transcriptional regulator
LLTRRSLAKAVRHASIQAVPKRQSHSAAQDRRSACPVAGALDLLGDRWTLVVLRDLFGGKCRFGQFLGSEETIPTNILADRLNRLEEAGLLRKVPYQDNPPRFEYELTAKGRDTRLIVASIAIWGLKHV